MKRTRFVYFLIFFAIAAALFFNSAYLGMKYDSFESRFKRVLTDGGFTLLSEEIWQGDEAPLPLALHLRPRIGGVKELLAGPDNPELEMKYVIKGGSTVRMECFVRFYESSLAIAEIRGAKDDRNVAESFRDVLSNAFPGLPVDVNLQ